MLYSSEVPVNAAITETRSEAPVQTITPNSTPPQTIYFNEAAPHANIPFALITYTSGLPSANTFDVTPSAANGLTYNTGTRMLSIDTKCGDDNSANKSIRLVVNDDPDPNNVSKPLTLDITVHSGAAECIEPINAQAQTFNDGGTGQEITEDLTAYALADVASAAASVVATVFVDGGAGEYTSTKESGGEFGFGRRRQGIADGADSGGDDSGDGRRQRIGY